MRKAKPRRKQWSLNNLYALSRAAPVVWCGLQVLAVRAGSSVVCATRKQLAETTGIARHNTISEGLTALEAAGWIDRVLMRVAAPDGGIRRLLKVVLLYGQQNSPLIQRYRMSNENRCMGKQRKSLLDSPTERGGSRRRPFEGADGTRQDPLPEHPSAVLERELMAKAKAEREARQGVQMKIARA
jgi:hypothetical protein